MDDDFDTEWCTPHFQEAYSRRFRPIDLAVLGLNLCAGVTRSFANTFELAQSLAAGHANYQGQREAFQEKAAIELETLIEHGDENG